MLRVTKLVCLLILTLFWLALCGLLAIPGFLIPDRKKKIKIDRVLQSKTLCRLLYEKAILTEEEYNFETQRVAAQYSDPTFSGYLFIISPIVFAMKTTDVLDPLVEWLIRRWIKVQTLWLDNLGKANLFDQGVAILSIQIATALGKGLSTVSNINDTPN